MKFDGYWVFGAGNKVWLTSASFDETELSNVSGWTQAWENGATNRDGFVLGVPEALINNVFDRILRREKRFVEIDPSQDYRGEIITVGTLESLAAFVSRLQLSSPRKPAEVSRAADNLPDDRKIPF